MWENVDFLPEELAEELKNMTAEEKSDAFRCSLTFGTGGLRGVLGAGTNRMNVYTVSQATRGLGRYLLTRKSDCSCAVSCDTRIHSTDFARLTAATLAEMGIKVYIYPAPMPTPMLSFAVRHYHCDAGVMVTASHNPAKYNGYKAYGADGCQIGLEEADAIQGFMSREELLVNPLPDFDTYLNNGMITFIDQEAIETYYGLLLANRPAQETEPINVVYTPLYGTGCVPVQEIMKRMGNVKVSPVEEQLQPNGHFPTCPYPNPEIAQAMKLAMEQTLATGADFCFATDPDCDRMGAGVNCGDHVTLITGNEMGILLLDYLLAHTDKKNGVVVKTIVSTEMVRPLCKKYGLEMREVLTGFKFIGEIIGQLEAAGTPERYLFGFEESYGYLSHTNVRDKDAVNAAMLVCDMAASLKKQGKTMLDRLAELSEEFGFFGQKLLTFEYEGAAGQEIMGNLMKQLREGALPMPASMVDVKKTDYLYDETGLPKSDVLTFASENGQKVIVRPSGTEPKLKAYLFATGKDKADADAQLATMAEAVAAVLTVK